MNQISTIGAIKGLKNNGHRAIAPFLPWGGARQFTNFNLQLAMALHVPDARVGANCPTRA